MTSIDHQWQVTLYSHTVTVVNDQSVFRIVGRSSQKASTVNREVMKTTRAIFIRDIQPNNTG